MMKQKKPVIIHRNSTTKKFSITISDLTRKERVGFLRHIKEHFNGEVEVFNQTFLGKL
jgi:hypothetical protein